MPKRNLEIKCYFFVMSSVVETSLVFSEIIVRDSSTARNDRLSEFIEYYANKADAKLPNGAKRR